MCTPGSGADRLSRSGPITAATSGQYGVHSYPLRTGKLPGPGQAKLWTECPLPRPEPGVGPESIHAHTRTSVAMSASGLSGMGARMTGMGAKLLARGRPERLLPGSPDWAADDRLGCRFRPFAGSQTNRRNGWLSTGPLPGRYAGKPDPRLKPSMGTCASPGTRSMPRGWSPSLPCRG